MDTQNSDFQIESGNDSDEEIPLTAAQVIQTMQQAWLNENFAPEILPHKFEIVECLLGQISYMEENLHNLESADFQKTLHQMEINRLRFIVVSYLRSRLNKIEMFVHAVLRAEEQRRERKERLYLTDAELQFAKDYKDSIEQHFNDLLQFWRGAPQSDEWRTSVLPNLNSFVFAKSNSAIEGVMINSGNDDGEDDFLDLRDQSQIIISYNSIANLIKNGNVQLI